jgi:hypothetical protein
VEYYDTTVQTCDMVTRYVSLFSIWLHNIDTGFELILLTKPIHVELTGQWASCLSPEVVDVVVP